MKYDIVVGAVNMHWMPVVVIALAAFNVAMAMTTSTPPEFDEDSLPGAYLDL